jgi:hypothetical protein
MLIGIKAKTTKNKAFTFFKLLRNNGMLINPNKTNIIINENISLIIL